MLVLTRKINESIRLGSEIVVTVIEVRGGRVRLGISAPNSVPVIRTELLAEQPGGTEHGGALVTQHLHTA